jgi:hypothetical protein
VRTHRITASLVALVGTGGALWLVRDRLMVVALLALGCAGLLIIGLRTRPAPAVGILQVDDLGRVFWNGTAMQIARWQRSERSVWIRLCDQKEDAGREPNAAVGQLDVTAAATACSPESWAALQRWLTWLERGSHASEA